MYSGLEGKLKEWFTLIWWRIFHYRNYSFRVKEESDKPDC